MITRCVFMCLFASFSPKKKLSVVCMYISIEHHKTSCSPVKLTQKPDSPSLASSLNFIAAEFDWNEKKNKSIFGMHFFSDHFYLFHTNSMEAGPLNGCAVFSLIQNDKFFLSILSEIVWECSVPWFDSIWFCHVPMETHAYIQTFVNITCERI